MTKPEVIKLIVGQHVDLETMRPPAKTLPAPTIRISGSTAGEPLRGFSIALSRGRLSASPAIRN